MANKEKEVVWSSRAKFELEDILQFYLKSNGSPSYSLKILNEVEELLEILSRNGFVGRLTSNKITRVIPMKVYLIFYEINKDHIEIVSFWDNRQNENKKIIR